jgi:sugar/nucleoside kinase (ribokinase family)
MSENAAFDVLCVGNAIVDILARTEDDFLHAHALVKGSMNLVDAERSAYLYSKMGPAIEQSGGSAGNTAAGLSALGASAAFVGKVAQDTLGDIYHHDMIAQGVHFDCSRLDPLKAPTARSMILITPDGERTMNTYLGACVELGPEDMDPDVVAGSAITYYEGYLWDPPRAKDALRKAAEIAHANNRKMAITLSDSFCVERWRDEFLELIRSKTVDIVFANEHEAMALYQTDDLTAAMNALAEECALSVVTLGAAGAVTVQGGERIAVPAVKVDKVIDLTGAGDLFAAGYLYGLTRGWSPQRSAELGTKAAAVTIEQIGPRPASDLRQFLTDT